MIRITKLSLILIFILLSISAKRSDAQTHSIAREWNEAVLESIRNDFARPTIHARNLFHTSIAMYDAWALFDDKAQTYLIGQSRGHFESNFDQADIESLRSSMDLDETISFAIYRIILHRYAEAPGFIETRFLIRDIMMEKGYDLFHTSTDYTDQNPASLGNFIAEEIIAYGLQDGSNEENDYVNTFYQPLNSPLNPRFTGIDSATDPNHWQPLSFGTFIDQAGNPIGEEVPEFLSPEWGYTSPFSLEISDKEFLIRDNNLYQVYLNPGAPPLLDEEGREEYNWGFSLVAEWSAHLDPEDDTQIDISPASIGNIEEFPTTFEEYKAFYKSEGGDWGEGRAMNPRTNLPYEPQIVPRGDYARVLAEFWADGPDSETPPGHWFTITNYVMDHPDFTRNFAGGDLLEDLEYDVKTYFMLGGAVHDAAIAAWSVKGYYDYIRPISAIRYMASLGQSSDPNLPRYHPDGIRLIPDVIELIEAGDPDFPDSYFLGEIKVKTWKGPDYIQNPFNDVAGVGWILCGDWWPYQRPTFVTPPFAGYVSGHSTFSRAAAEVLTFVTNDEYFPGGMGTFEANKDDFLVFENGPSKDLILQWATYRDASDQCSLSRIWGGIHPPVDDIPGRRMGAIIGEKAIGLSNEYFNGEAEIPTGGTFNNSTLTPNIISVGEEVLLEIDGTFDDMYIVNNLNQVLYKQKVVFPFARIPTETLSTGIYYVVLVLNKRIVTRKLVIL